MLTLIVKVLFIVLLHSLKITSQKSTMLYPSTYWKTTYVSDKVPDYWNHGIFAPKLPKSEKQDIFPSWLIKITTKLSSQITETDKEDYDIEILKTSTDKVFSINNAEIEKVPETLEADLAAHDTTDWTELTTRAPRVITRTAVTKTNSIMINSIVATTPPASEKNIFTHSEHETTIDDYDDGDNDLFVITMTPNVITSTSKSISNSIITENTYTTAPTKSEKRDFTRPEFETSLDDDDTNSPLITVNTSTINSAEKSISDSIISDIHITTTPKSKKKDFTRPEYETTIDDHDAHRPFITMKPSVITSTEASRSESIITEGLTTQTSKNIYFTRPVYETTINDDDAPQLTTNNPSLIVSIEETQPNSITTDSNLTTVPATEYETHPNSTKIAQQTSSPEYDTTFFYYDANLNKPQKSSTLEFETPVLDDEYITTMSTSTTMSLSSSNPYGTTLPYATSISTRITQQTSTPEYDTTVHNYISMTQPKSPTTRDHDTKNDDNEANYLSKIMTLPSISYDSKFARLKRTRMTRKSPKHGRPMYARTKRSKNKLSKTTISSSIAHPVTVYRAVNKEVGSDQFSVFLRKLLIVLSVKRLEDLPLLINQFKEYLWMLLTNGQTGKLGLDINSFLAQKVMVLDNWPVKAIRKSFDTLQKKLANRNRELAKDINDILDYMDDTYDEAEEEAMQAVLHEASLFPNTKNYYKIAQGFVDYVFLHPMQRVMGTTRGNVLFGMITDALKIRDAFKEEHKIPSKEDLRKNFEKIRKHLRQLSDVSSDEPSVNRSYTRKFQDSEDKSDSNSDNFSENSKTVKSPNGVNENKHSDEPEGSKETIESKYYGYKNNVNIVARNGPFQNRVFTNENKVRNTFSKLRTLRYLLKTKLRTLDNNKGLPQHLPRKHSWSTIANRANFHETTESSNIEMELKAKIYETFRRMNLVSNNYSRRMRQGIKSTVNVKDDSYEETDVERVLKKNIYKAVKKLLK